MLTLDAVKSALKYGEHDRWLWAVPVLLALFVNLNVLQNGFGLDDEEIIQNLGASHQWWQLLLPVGASSSGENSPYFRPLVSISYLLDHALWNYHPFGFHFSLWVAHILNTALVFFLARELVIAAGSIGNSGQAQGLAPTSSPLTPHSLLPFFTASLFAVHPIHAEAVAWIAGRSDLFCTTFLLSSFLFYIRFNKTQSLFLYGGSMLAFFFALLTKEIAVGLIALFPLYDYLSAPDASRPWKRIGVRSAVPLAILCVYFWFRTVSITFPHGGSASSDPFSFSIVSKMIGTAGLYLKMLAVPYPHTPFIATLPASLLFLILTGLALVMVSWGVIFSVIRRKILPGIGLAWMIILLAPPVLVAVLDLTTTPAAERYVYAPSIGFLIVVAWLIQRGGKRLAAVTSRQPAMVWSTIGLLFVVIAGAWAKESWARNAVWRSPVTFWEAAVAQSPESGVPYIGLGAHYAMLGRNAEAEELYRRAIAMDEKIGDSRQASTAMSLLNLADLYYSQGRYAEAEPRYRGAITIFQKHLGPNHRNVAIGLHNLAGLYAAQKRYAEAEPVYQKAVAILEKRLGPDHFEVAKGLHNLSRLYLMESRYPEAESPALRSLMIREKSLGPEHPAVASSLLNLAEVYRAQARYAEAESLYRQSLTIWEKALGPESAELATTLENYADLLRKMKRDTEAAKMEARAAAIREKQSQEHR